MEFIEWDQKFEVGEIRIDIQHKHLVSLINMLHAGVNAGMNSTIVGNILDELDMYVIVHFTYEEKWMEAREYPEADSHKKQHLELRQKLANFRSEYQHDPDLPCGPLCDFLRKWLLEHVLEEDKKFSAYV